MMLSPDSLRLATLKGGEVIHHTDPPVYHGNPMDAAGGSLVFEIPGWDLLARARRAGFGQAVMRYVCDQSRAITASNRDEKLPAQGVFIGVFDR